MKQHFTEGHQVRMALAETAAGTSTVTSGIIDTKSLGNFGACCFIVRVATDAANNIVTFQHSDTVDGTTGASTNGVITGATALSTDIAGSSIEATVNGDSIVYDLRNCTKRYVQVKVTRGTSTAVGTIYAILYDPQDQPVSTPANIILEQHNAALSGTA